MSDPCCKSVVNCIQTPDSCLLSTRQYFMSVSADTIIDVAGNSADHGLKGSLSNRAKMVERTKFARFVWAHRSPTGRTADKWGRFHGASFYLDAKWVALRGTRQKGTTSRQTFSESFNEALIADGLPAVHADVPRRWLREMFGSFKRLEGRSVPSDEHTTLYSHKTDAFATSCFFQEDPRQANQTLKRHRQRSDQESLDRRQAIKDTLRLINDVEQAMVSRKDNAASAIAYHHWCVDHAAERYRKLSEMFEAVLSDEAMQDQPTDLSMSNEKELMCQRASDEWHDVSSDYQQDKAVPSWSLSPQPGLTYCTSGETHYVHIFCDESCGEAAGASRFSRNVVYSRSEVMGGAKSSDDTLSTLCDLLLGRTHIGGDDPPVFRSGYGPEGAVDVSPLGASEG